MFAASDPPLNNLKCPLPEFSVALAVYVIPLIVIVSSYTNFVVLGVEGVDDTAMRVINIFCLDLVFA